MPNTEYVYLTGHVKWAQVKKPDDWGNYSLVFYPDEESLNKFVSLKLKNKINQDEDGKWIRLRSPVEKLMKGRMTKFDPPPVVDADGNPITDYIGNGSNVTIKLVVYTFTRGGVSGKGSRIEKIRVNKLVKYEPNREEVSDASNKKEEELPF